MERGDLKDLSRDELVDVVYNMVNDRAVERPTSREVYEERKRLRRKARIRR